MMATASSSFEAGFIILNYAEKQVNKEQPTAYKDLFLSVYSHTTFVLRRHLTYKT